eukprot:m51a1_g1672 hypothetical protein (191) ;mRNA; f:393058-393800
MMADTRPTFVVPQPADAAAVSQSVPYGMARRTGGASYDEIKRKYLSSLHILDATPPPPGPASHVAAPAPSMPAPAAESGAAQGEQRRRAEPMMFEMDGDDGEPVPPAAGGDEERGDVSTGEEEDERADADGDADAPANPGEETFKSPARIGRVGDRGAGVGFVPPYLLSQTAQGSFATSLPSWHPHFSNI